VAQARGQGSGVRPARHPISLGHGIQSELRAPMDHAEGASFDTAPRRFERPFEAPRHRTVFPAEADAAIPPAPGFASGSVAAEVQPVTPDDDVAGRPIMTRVDAKDALRPVTHPQPEHGYPQSDSGTARRVADAEHTIIDNRPLPIRPLTAADETPSDVADRPRSNPQTSVAPRIAARLVRDRPVPRPSRPEAAAPADVHIHIGRVELTAIAPAAPARRGAAAAARKPMSLEEYLSQRGRRPS
jgi:hypothetical protein